MLSEQTTQLVSTLPAEIRIVFEQVLSELPSHYESEVSGLNSRIVSLEAAQEALTIENQALRIENQALRTENQALRIENQALRAKLSMNSRTSSKPPSSDGYKKPSPKNSRKKTGRSSGGQKGHEGTSLKMQAKADVFEYHDVHQCKHCQTDLSNFPVDKYIKRQVLDIPPLVKLLCTEHQAAVKTCSCGHVNCADFPVGVDRYVQYGSNIKSLVVYFQDHQLLPYSRTKEIISDLFGYNLSEGTLYNIRQSAYNKLADFEAQLKQLLTACVLAGFDETGMRVMTKLHWLHSCSTKQHAYYAIDAKRGKEAMDNIGILPEFKGIAVHDFWRSYYQYLTCQHSLCNAHILRELAFVEQNCKQAWAGQLIALLVQMKKAKEKALEQGKTKLSKSTLYKYTKQYHDIIEQGFQDNPYSPPKEKKRGRPKKPKPRNLVERLRDYQTDILRFFYDFKAPFDNNFSERDIRMMKLKQKISGCFRSIKGAQMFARTRSFIITARKQGHNILNALKELFNNQNITARLIQA